MIIRTQYNSTIQCE